MKVNPAVSFNSKVNQNIGSNSQVQLGRRKEQQTDSYSYEGSKEPTVTIPRSKFNNMMKALAFVSILGGMGAVNSCSDASSPVAPPNDGITDTTTIHDTTGTDTTHVLPIDTPKVVQRELSKMLFDVLKLNPTTSGIDKSAQDGEFKKLTFYSPWDDADIELKQNLELSSKDTLVMDEKIMPRFNAPSEEKRHKLTKLGEGKLLDTRFSKLSNGTYIPVAARKFITKGDTIKEYLNFDNSLSHIYIPKTPTSIKNRDSNNFEIEYVDITMEE